MPTIVQTVAQWKSLRAGYRAKAQSIGFVPTMGALHPGHGSLFVAAKKENPIVLATVFVNPTQFDDPWDFQNYPRVLDKDTERMAQSGVDVILAPSVQEMYPNGTRYTVAETEFSKQLCGAHRPGHFTGMLTVVMKLLQIADAEKAYFGEKDFQQLALIRGMAEAFFLPTQIIGCPTIREADGLAMSSRNTRLSKEERTLAPTFHKALTDSPTAAEARTLLEAAGFEVDYVEDREQRRFGAVRLGKTRLIDNVAR